MNTLIIGGVAAGTKAAAKLKRENSEYKVTLITKEKNISYAGCGLPYYIGGIIEDKKDLIVKTPEEFERLTGVQVFTEIEAKEILTATKEVKALNLATGEEKTLKYDSLIIATGAAPLVPPLEGGHLKGLYTVRTPEDAIKIREAVEAGGVKRAVVVGGGFIGIEVAENLIEKGVKVTLLEMASQILPGFDEEIAIIAEEELLNKGVMALTEERVLGLEGTEKVEKVVTSKRKIKADMVIMSVGVRPNTALAKAAGIALGEKGTILVNEYMETNIKDIYAVGDCAECKNLLSGKKAWYPMGSTANKMGRAAAINISGGKAEIKGFLGTTIVKIFDISAGKTGLTEAGAREAGFDPVSIIVPANDKAHYYTGAKTIITKLIADKTTRRILGAQIIGGGVVDKPIDIIATAISLKGTLEDLENLDLAYAPPFSMAMASTIVAANVLINKLEGKVDTLTPKEFLDNKEDYKILDIRSEEEYEEKHIEGAVSIPMASIEEQIKTISKETAILLVCRIGRSAYVAFKKLKALGYKNVKILEGGMAIPQK